MIELSDVIRDLRSELEAAVDAAPADGLRFELGPIELEVSVGLDRSGGASAKVRFWVLDLGPEGSVKHASTQRVKLTLQPRLGDSGRSPYVSGAQAAQER
ncbi:trypco2 family protein [Dactylosporangium sucinum]|uniref:Trypsin-co-occurring domain-containing protein n=1 Tax=Dactylosporangium sucinum TaxID=1424081 RepID=A0A917TB26_9ACTN|nr:trypco2 family protein [Dactylosporangium sucinum]GGM16222.1 hypothetical protein GCM10007977_016870 [Dactylosporangium sucinum]